MAEACWVVERGRTSIPSVAALLTALDNDPRFTLSPLDRAVIDKTTTLPALETHDRQIVATALGMPDRGEAVSLLTRDDQIVAAGLVPVVW